MVMHALVLASLSFITVHGPDGQEINVNIPQISTLRAPRQTTEEHFAPGTRCLIIMTNNRLITATETCVEVVKKITAVIGQKDQ
jgi:hypothetical protein